MLILSQLISTSCEKLKQKKIAKLNEASCPDDKSLLVAGWYIVRASVMLAATTDTVPLSYLLSWDFRDIFSMRNKPQDHCIFSNTPTIQCNVAMTGSKLLDLFK